MHFVSDRTLTKAKKYGLILTKKDGTYCVNVNRFNDCGNFIVINRFANKADAMNLIDFIKSFLKARRNLLRRK